MALRTVGARLTLEIGDFKAKMLQAGQATRSFKADLDKAAQTGKLDAVADRAAKVGFALTGMAAYAIKAAADFDRAMSAVSAATHASASDIDRLRAAAIQAGKDTQYSATEAAAGITELSKAGVGTADVLNGGLKGALALAAAGQISVGEAAETAASALTQFKLSGAQVPHVADLLAAAAGKAQGSVHDVGQALNQSGLVAAQFGLSIEDTVGALAEFANAGLIGSDAGTSFKTMLAALANPSKQTRAEMDDLGISFYDAHGKFIGLSGVAQVLQTRLKGVSDETRQQALSQLFGNDAVRAASILYADGAAGVQKWRKGVDDSAYAVDTAAKLTDNLAGDLERLKGSVETLAIESGTGANGGLRVLAKGLESLVNSFAVLPSGVSSTVTVIAGLSGAALLAGAGWVKLRKSTANVVEELRNVGPIGVKAATGLQATTKWAGRAGLAFVGLQTVGMAMNAAFGQQLNPQVDALGQSLEKWASTGEKTGEAARLLGDDFSHLQYDLGSLGSGFWAKAGNGIEGVFEGLTSTGDVWDETLQHAKERLQAIDQAMASMVQNGQGAQAGQVFQALADEAKKAGISVSDLKKGLPGYEGALQAAGGAAKGATGKLGDLNSALQVGASAQNHYKTAADAVAGAARGEKGALSALSTQIKAQSDPVFALIEAQKGLKEAQKDVTKATKQHGAKSDEARAANLRLAQAAIELQAANGNLTTSFNGKLSPAMRATLEAAGLTKGEIKNVEGQFKTAKTAADKYSGQYKADASAPGARTVKGDFDKAYAAAKEYQGKYEAQVSAPGAKQSKTDIDLAHTAANGYAGPYLANLAVHGEDKVDAAFRRISAKQQALKSANAINMRNGFAEGGWTGPGSKYEPAGVVHADEFVMSKSSRGQLEQQKPGALDYMNSTGQWPGYAAGGQVWPFPVDVSKTKIPQIAALGGGAGPGGGQTYKWILDVVHHAFPGLHATSTFRPGAVTLSGNRSYHAVGRAVDWPPSKALAEWVNTHYGHATRELITPWNSLNIKNGARHAYSGEIFAQHAGTGRWKGNAHDHWAMANGGVIPEHVIGVGRSGRTYEFGEGGRPELVTPLRGYAGGGYVNVAPSASTSPRSGTRLDYYDSLLSATNAVAQFTAALKENKRALSTRTQKGRDDRAALISGVRAAQEAAKARYEETGSIRAANKVYDEYIHKLDAAMKKMHVNTKTRREMIKAYSEKPKYDVPAASAPSNSSARIKSVQDYAAAEQSLSDAKTAFAWTKPTFSARTVTGRSELQTLFTYLGAAEQAAQSQYQETGNAGSATKLYNSYLTQLRAILARSGMSRASIDSLFKQYGRITLTRNRWGGLYQHAATGALSEAQIAPGGPTRYAWAESSTGGELFAPKHGDLQKTRREVGWAVANWWGGQVNWGGKGGGAARHMTIEAPITIQLGAETITRQVRFEVDTALGQVATAVIHQSA